MDSLNNFIFSSHFFTSRQEAFQALMQNDEEQMMHSMFFTILQLLLFFTSLVTQTSFIEQFWNELEISVSCVIFYKMFS